MLHAGMDLSRKRLDVCLLADGGELVARTAVRPDADGLHHLVRRVAGYGLPVRGVMGVPRRNCATVIARDAKRAEHRPPLARRRRTTAVGRPLVTRRPYPPTSWASAFTSIRRQESRTCVAMV